MVSAYISSKVAFVSVFGRALGGSVTSLPKEKTTYVLLLASRSPCFAVWCCFRVTWHSFLTIMLRFRLHNACSVVNVESLVWMVFAAFGRWSILLVFAAIWAKIPALVFSFHVGSGLELRLVCTTAAAHRQETTKATTDQQNKSNIRPNTKKHKATKPRNQKPQEQSQTRKQHISPKPKTCLCHV